jgi:hypothetical protein
MGNKKSTFSFSVFLDDIVKQHGDKLGAEKLYELACKPYLRQGSPTQRELLTRAALLGHKQAQQMIPPPCKVDFRGKVA